MVSNVVNSCASLSVLNTYLWLTIGTFSTVTETGAVDVISFKNLSVLAFLDYFTYPLCLIFSLFRPSSHQTSEFLELVLYFFFKINNKSAVLCIWCFLAELKTVCIMH